LGIVLLLPLALELGTDVQELAGAALAACVFQATAHWALRRRRESTRQALIAEIRGLLRDRINNHLQVVLFSLADGRGRSSPAEDRERLAQAIAAVTAVSRTLDELSSDSLRRWKARYASSLSDAATAAGNGAGSGRDGSAAGR
jgi:two-component sensor histidine kinase